MAISDFIFFFFFQWDVSNKPYTELFPLEKLVYLTPDSNKVLSSIEADKIYIIGGLVDESVQKVKKDLI